MMRIVMGIVGLAFLLASLILLKFGVTWLRAYVAGAPVSFIELIAMYLRKIPVRKIVDLRIMLVKNGISAPSVDDLCTHVLAGGDMDMVEEGLLKAKEQNIDLSFAQACELDLEDKGIQRKTHQTNSLHHLNVDGFWLHKV